MLTTKEVRNRGLIWAGIITAIDLALGIVGIVENPNDLTNKIMGVLVFAVFLFAFVAQMKWGGFIYDTVTLGGKVIGTPGIIFTFDLDGFIFLIGMKILFALLRMFVFIITFLIFFVVAFFLSVFTFIPRLLRINRDIHKNSSIM